MTISVTQNADGSHTVSCGTESVTIASAAPVPSATASTGAGSSGSGPVSYPTPPTGGTGGVAASVVADRFLKNLPDSLQKQFLVNVPEETTETAEGLTYLILQPSASTPQPKTFATLQWAGTGTFDLSDIRASLDALGETGIGVTIVAPRRFRSRS